MHHTALVTFGSNIEARKNRQRVERILSFEQQLVDRSSFEWTEPEGIVNQPRFLNGAYLVGTNLDESEFRAYLKELEDRLGRDRTGPKAGPRTVDLDLVLWDSEIVHADFHRAPYVQAPIEELISRNDIAPRSRLGALEEHPAS